VRSGDRVRVVSGDSEGEIMSGGTSEGKVLHRACLPGAAQSTSLQR